MPSSGGARRCALASASAETIYICHAAGGIGGCLASVGGNRHGRLFTLPTHLGSGFISERHHYYGTSRDCPNDRLSAAGHAATSTSGSDIPWTPIAIAVAGWIFWFLIFTLLGSAPWSRRFRWMYRTLIAGTILELLITIPIDAYVRKRTSCYCGEGTFWSLAIGLTAILWTFGPGVAILFFVRRHQLLAESGCCLQCGYNLYGLASNRCPECGTFFAPSSGNPA